MYKSFVLFLVGAMFFVASCGNDSGGGKDTPVTDEDLPAFIDSVVINEVLVKASQGNDWIELFNKGDSEVDLRNWIIKDSNDDNSYTFPSGTKIAAGEFIVIEQGSTGFDFGLGKEDSVVLIDSSDRIVDSIDWVDGEVPEDKSYGRIPDGSGEFSTLDNPTKGQANLANLILVITSPADNTIFKVGETITFSATAKDGNGKELENASWEWSSSKSDLLSDKSSFEKEDLVQGTHKITVKVTAEDGAVAQAKIEIHVDPDPLFVQNDASLYINEFMAINEKVLPDPDFNEYVDWIEIYNDGSEDIDMSGYQLADSSEKWLVPQGVVIKSKGFVLFYADSKDNGNHTNFKLSGDGEIITLYDASGSLLSSITYYTQLPDISYGISSEDETRTTWIYMSEPTPGAANK